MKIIPFKKKGRVYELLNEISLNYGEDGIQVIASGVRVFIRGKKGKLIIKIPDVRTRFRVDPDEREFILFKKAKAKEEV